MMAQRPPDDLDRTLAERTWSRNRPISPDDHESCGTAFALRLALRRPYSPVRTRSWRR